MGHFAKVVDGKVATIIVAEKEFFDTYVDSSPGKWIQTSYNTRGGVHYNPVTGEPSEDQSKALRGNYAGTGYTYDEVNDVFYEPKPFPSWSLNTTTWLWEAPIPCPNDGKFYLWNESAQNWEEQFFPE
jgi:hypothetical protein